MSGVALPFDELLQKRSDDDDTTQQARETRTDLKAQIVHDGRVIATDWLRRLHLKIIRKQIGGLLNFFFKKKQNKTNAQRNRKRWRIVLASGWCVFSDARQSARSPQSNYRVLLVNAASRVRRRQHTHTNKRTHKHASRDVYRSNFRFLYCRQSSWRRQTVSPICSRIQSSQTPTQNQLKTH